MRTTLFITGLAAGLGEDAAILDLGPRHPMNAGMLEMAVEARDGIVSCVEVRPGAGHRGADMLFEVRDYRQGLSLANRHDWQAPFFGELALASLVERELGVEIPARAVWLRTALAEHYRVHSHLGFLSFVGWRLRRPDLATDAVREQLRQRALELTGNRVHPMAVRLGGVAVDADAAWIAAELATLAEAAALADRIADAVAASGLGLGVAPVDAATVRGFGLSGPTARASGVAADLRRDEPTLAYPDLRPLLGAALPTGGDAAARLLGWAIEVGQSARLVGAALASLPTSALAVKLPKVVKLPEGDAYLAVEAPLGRAGVFVVSRGEGTPWRLHLRTPSFAHVSAWPHVLPGTPASDLDVAVASLPYVPGDLDK